jgi:alcohol dehydrogenase (NADP+)
MYKSKAYSAASATSPLAADTIDRRDLTQRTMSRSKFSSAASAIPTFIRCVTSEANPCPRPTRSSLVMKSSVGSAVTQFKIGDLAGGSCIVDSDSTCPQCKEGLEQFCPNVTLTYNFPTNALAKSPVGAAPIVLSSININSEFKSFC